VLVEKFASGVSESGPDDALRGNDVNSQDDNMTMAVPMENVRFEFLNMIFLL